MEEVEQYILNRNCEGYKGDKRCLQLQGRGNRGESLRDAAHKSVQNLHGDKIIEAFL